MKKTKIISILLFLLNILFVTYQCDPKCTTCNTSNQCIMCSENRINPPTCNCPPGFLDTNEPECPQQRNKCLIPNDHILHINDSINHGSIPI